MLNDFIDKLKSGYYKKGGIWEFDWYIDTFFVEVMAYGNYPIKLGYMQPILGDQFLTFKYEDHIRSEYKDFFRDQSRVKKLIQNQKAIIKAADLLINQLKNQTLDFDKYEKVQKDLSLLMASVSVVFDHLITKEINDISQREKISTENLIGYIVNKSNHTKLSESNQKLLSIYKKFKKEIDQNDFQFEKFGSKLQNKLTEHEQKYGWLNTGEKGSHEWKAEDFTRQLKDIVNKREVVTNDKPKIKNEKLANAIVNINLNDNMAADRQIELDYLFQKILKTKLGRYYIEDITDNLTYEELKNVWDRPRLVNSFKNRKGNNLRVVWPQEYKLHFRYFATKEEFAKVEELLQKREVVSQEIHGTVASMGKSEGVVRIVRTQNDLREFKEGEVLVAEKTQPKYVTAMNKAVAIVTDTGGVTSHAAIISREFGIPCIVGTNNATTILKNGDKVLVDAEEGIVTKV